MLIRSATTKDLEQIFNVLESARLSTEGIEQHVSCFAIGEKDSVVVSVGGYEKYGEVALLRSVAVIEKYRHRGYAKEICNFIEAHAKQSGVINFYLLTETAQNFFAHRGFVNAIRSEAPHVIKTTQQFSSLCPDSAAFMCRAA